MEKRNILTAFETDGKIRIFLSKRIAVTFGHAVFRYGSGYEEIPETEISQKKDGVISVRALCRGAEKADITFTESGGAVSVRVDYSGRPLSAENGIRVFFSLEDPDNVLTIYKESPWWTKPWFEKDPEQWQEDNSLLVFERDKRHICMLPLPGDDYSSKIGRGFISVSVGCATHASVKGTFLRISADSNPVAAVRGCYSGASKSGEFSVPLYEDRKVPDIADGLGWCTWNAMYTDITEEKLISKMEEFKEKNVPLKWVLIDDGWQKLDRSMLVSLAANKEKFPEGLKHAVDIIKSYGNGIKVGVWITINAYWDGLQPESETAEQYRGELTWIRRDDRIVTVVPSVEPEKAEVFWDAYFRYLSDCGIDFLKIDNQSSYPKILSRKGDEPYFSRTVSAHRAIENAASRHFGGGDAVPIINCMGMGQENVFARPRSSISRNSNDFYPEIKDGFRSHLMLNGWNSVWHGCLYCADYDMWTTDDEWAKSSAVLRAISGGPVYISDQVGKTVPSLLKPIADSEGNVSRFPGAAVPTPDVFYRDCDSLSEPVKLYNSIGSDFAVAVFNLDSKARTVSISGNDLPGIDAEAKYMAYEFFSRTWTPFDPKTGMKIKVKPKESAAVSLYLTDGKTLRYGDTSRYFPVLTPAENAKKISWPGIPFPEVRIPQISRRRSASAAETDSVGK